ncbi:MAG: hypothetical protein WC783_03345 [Candidatus Paceibacterota bacterium]|jgi:hypothetical protein
MSVNISTKTKPFNFRNGIGEIDENATYLVQSNFNKSTWDKFSGYELILRYAEYMKNGGVRVIEIEDGE